ncbi:DUF2523 family protein [Vibrio scophthalmi]|uniref:DUF2523 family protein n=1 Tax=Vibrio scophthalmi TaxID=45658 RepID=UPI003EBC25A0
MSWITDLFNKLISFLYSLILSLVEMIKDVFLWAMEEIFKAVKLLLSTVFGLFDPVDIGQYLDNIPPNVAWVMSAVGLPQCLTIIIAAITVRILLQLVPFTRLGS